MWIGEELDSMVVCVANHQMLSVRLKTQACWFIEITKMLLASLAKGTEVLQCMALEPLQTVVAEIRDNQFFMLLIIDDGPRIVELSICIPFLASGAQERLLLHSTIQGFGFLIGFELI